MSARDYALAQLDAKTLPGWPPRLMGGRADHRTPSDPRDLALAEHITAGVIKNVLLLQHLLQHHSGRTLAQIDPLLQKILAIGLYQLRFLTRVPPSAAVDQAVQQAKRSGQGRAAGMVNAVLRKVARDPAPPLPDRTNPADYALRVLSHPRELFRRLQTMLGVEDALRFCEHNQQEPPLLLRSISGALEKQPLDEGVTLEPHEQPSMFVATGLKRATLAAWAQAGIAQAQDATAADVISNANIAPNQRVLDRCCGLGTKTLQLWQAVQPQGSVLAMDPNSDRCEALSTLLRKRAINGVDVVCAAWLTEVPPPTAHTFDCVLVDAPCSNSGVLARRPEARFSQTAAQITSVSELARKILDDSARAPKPTGLLIYSTCSIWSEENRACVDQFLSTHPDYQLLDDKLTLPSFGAAPTAYRDGGYWALMRRKSI